jgi:hypothetical protein
MTKEKFLEIASARYDSICALNGLNNFYDYEKTLVDIMRDMGCNILEENLGERVADKRKKNFANDLWRHRSKQQ